MGYREVYDGWKADPERFWMRAADEIDWISAAIARPRRDPRAVLRVVLRRRLQHLPQRRRPPCRGAGTVIAIAIIHDCPVTGSVARITYAELLERVARLAGALRGARRRARATGSSSTCRWCRRRWWRCWPARGWARSTPWSSAASPRTSSRSGSTTPSRRRSSPPPAASSRAVSSTTSRWSMPRSSRRRAQARILPRPPARSGAAAS